MVFGSASGERESNTPGNSPVGLSSPTGKCCELCGSRGGEVKGEDLLAKEGLLLAGCFRDIFTA